MKRVALGLALILLPAGAPAQFPRLAPPPPCRAGATGSEPLLAMWGPDRATNSRPAVAIFPLVPEIDDPARVHLVVSLPDRVRQRLAMNPQLRMATDGSVSRAMLLSRDQVDSAAILIGANYLLTGRVYVSGGRQEIQLALRRPRGADTVWRATFRSTTTLRAVENAIVSGVSLALKVGNPTAFPRGWPTTDAAHDAILAGDVYLRSTTRAGADSAMVMYQLALEADPKSPVAAARLARAYVTVLQRGGAIAQYAGVAGTNRIFGLTTQALAGDSTLAEAWTVRAMLARLLDPESFEGAVPAHRRAVALSPTDAEAEHEYGLTLMRLGDARGAEARFRRALTLEPSRGATFAALSELELRADRWASACALSNAAIGAWPYDPMPYAVRAQARLHLSDARDAYADAEMVRRLTTGAWTAALRVLVASGASNVDVARRLVRELTADWLATGVPLSVRDGEYLALAYLAMGDQRRAIESLRRAEPIGTDLGVVLLRPALSPIRSDTAITRLLRETGARGR